jgi:hypothetical protein
MPGIQAQHDISVFQKFEDDGGFAPWITRHGWHLLFAYPIGLALKLTTRYPHVNIESGLEKIRAAVPAEPLPHGIGKNIAHRFCRSSCRRLLSQLP